MSFFDTDKILHISGALRSARYEYNKAFLEKGAIKFGTPQSWVDLGKKYGEGRGDIFEGMFVTFDKRDFNAAYTFGEKYNIPDKDIIIDSFENRIFYRRKQTMSLPTFCLYGIKYDIFDIIPQVGKQRICGVIPGEYFTAFSDIIDGSTAIIPTNEKPSTVFISNFDLFKERVILKLMELGVSENEIICEPIHYYDADVYGDNYWFEISSSSPKELLWKRKKFENQSEIRLIVNSKNKSAMNILRNEIIEVGELTDIAQIATADFKNGLNIEMTIDIGIKNGLQ